MNSNVLFTLFGISLILLLQTDFINAVGGDDVPDVEVDSDESGPIFGDVSVPDVHNNDTDGPQHLDFNEEDTSNEEGPSLSEGVSELGDNISGMDGPQIGDNERGSSNERVSDPTGTDGPQVFGDNEEENEEGVSNPVDQNTITNEEENEDGIVGVSDPDTNINGTVGNQNAGFVTLEPTFDDGMPESDGHPKGLNSEHLTKKLKGIAKTLKRMQKSLSDFSALWVAKKTKCRTQLPKIVSTSENFEIIILCSIKLSLLIVH